MNKRIFNSSLYLITAYYICHVLYVVSQFLILKLFNFKSLQLYFFYNSYLAQENSWWTRIKVYAVCGAGIVAIFALLFIVVIIFIKLSRKKTRLQVFYNWLIIVLSAFIIAEFFAPSFYTEYTNMYFILRWTRFEHLGGGMYIISVFSLLLIPLVSYFTYNTFLKMTNTTKDIKTRGTRIKFYLKNTFLPFIFLVFVMSILLSLVYSYDMNYFLSREGMRLGAIGLILIGGAIFSYNKNYISIQKSNLSHKISFPLSLFLIVAMVAYFFLINISH